ncbi:hypothetical protein [Halosimplex marinum]|uniref:hypothetical protein n=1 Tax=Halosimplex marinum TaxID=3396620 RepID=UPI003F5462A6
MSASDLTGDADGDATEAAARDRLRGELAALRAENERLRREFVRARQSRYRRSAATFAVVGLLAVVGGLLVADARTVLFALGGTGLFVAALLYFLTPARLIAASVGEAVYAPLARNEAELVSELGLRDARVYVPRTAGRTAAGGGNGEGERGPVGEVRLFVPQHADHAVPDGDDLDRVFVTPDDRRSRGVSLRPTGEPLYAEFERAVTGDPSDDPVEVAGELRDVLVEQFELVPDAAVDGDRAGGRVAVRVPEATFGGLEQFDHPVVSLLGVGVARAVGRPVTTETTSVDDDGTLVTCSWEPADAAGDA